MTGPGGDVKELSATSETEPGRDEAVRARIRRMLAVIVLVCLATASAGFAFVRWLTTLPPGTLKKP